MSALLDYVVSGLLLQECNAHYLHRPADDRRNRSQSVTTTNRIESTQDFTAHESDRIESRQDFAAHKSDRIESS